MKGAFNLSFLFVGVSFIVVSIAGFLGFQFEGDTKKLNTFPDFFLGESTVLLLIGILHVLVYFFFRWLNNYSAGMGGKDHRESEDENPWLK